MTAFFFYWKHLTFLSLKWKIVAGNHICRYRQTAKKRCELTRHQNTIGPKQPHCGKWKKKTNFQKPHVINMFYEEYFILQNITTLCYKDFEEQQPSLNAKLIDFNWGHLRPHSWNGGRYWYTHKRTAFGFTPPQKTIKKERTENLSSSLLCASLQGPWEHRTFHVDIYAQSHLRGRIKKKSGMELRGRKKNWHHVCRCTPVHVTTRWRAEKAVKEDDPNNSHSLF